MQTESKEETKVSIVKCYKCKGLIKASVTKLQTVESKEETATLIKMGCTEEIVLLSEYKNEICNTPWHESKFCNLIPKEETSPVEQAVDAGQLEKIIGDAFDAGAVRGYYEGQGVLDIEELTKDQYIKQAIELINNSKTQNHESKSTNAGAKRRNKDD